VPRTKNFTAGLGLLLLMFGLLNDDIIEIILQFFKSDHLYTSFIGVLLTLFVMMFAIYLPSMLAPPEALKKRLIFVLMGVAIIFGLSEFSKQVEKLRTAANPAAPSYLLGDYRLGKPMLFDLARLT
jgi:hypothetical protein